MSSMRVHRALTKSGLWLSVAALLVACGNPPVSGVPAEKKTESLVTPSPVRPPALAAPQPVRPPTLPAAKSTDRTLAPYFFVEGGSSAAESLPLKSTRADVQIAGSIADVQVTQIYKNQGKTPIEAVYLFPASTHAAVHAMKMTIGARIIEAQIREREAARRDYETARAQGRTASLLEQQRPNVFQMHVANIMPGDELKVELRYAELIVPNNHVYEFVYPTTVGPRYSNQPENQAAPSDKFISSPVLPQGTAAAHTFALDAVLQSAVPIRAIEAPSHNTARITQPQPAIAKVVLPEGNEQGNRDFVLRYSLEGQAIESGLLLAPGEKENYFLLMMEPPARVQLHAVVPREYIFVVDVSGSMNGFPLNVTKALMQHLFDGLRPQDKFNILSFSGGSALLAPSSLAATPEHVKQALDYTQSWIGGGGTELMPALKQVMALPRSNGTSRTIVVITDGYVSVEKEAFALIRDSLSEANVFAFGIGSSVNRFLIEGLARAGQGEPFIVLNEAEATEKAADFQSYIRAPVLQGVQAKFTGLDVYDVEPPALPDLFAEKPIVVQGKYRGAASGQVTVSGHAATGAFAQTIDVAGAGRGAPPELLATLWARTRIQRLTDWDRASQPTNKQEIIALGLAHHLMTSYTSFIAIDSAVRADGNKAVTVKQPSPMPAGVPNLAVESAKSAGLAGIFGTSGWGGNTALGRDAEDAMGGLVGTEIGDSYGSGGLGLVGTGRGGGGGIGEGTMGLSNRKFSAGTYGTKAGNTYKLPAPEVILGALEVRGPLVKEIIIRITRRHINELKFCYERELTRDTTLQGRLLIQFTIAPTGAVLASIVQSSTFSGRAVDQCIAAAVRRWEFPKSPSLNIVTYPFVFRSASK